MLRRALTGFSHINRFWHQAEQQTVAKLGPGDYYVTRDDEMLSTVLGSCISVCIYDIENEVGGMNHFMLPVSKNKKLNLLEDTFRFGDQAMEVLINSVCKHGGVKQNLMFKAFGGGQMLQNMSPIGDSNIRFLHQFMRLEQFELASSDLGGPFPRLVRFYPRTGRVIVKKLQQLASKQIAQEEINYFERVEQLRTSSDQSELFE